MLQLIHFLYQTNDLSYIAMTYQLTESYVSMSQICVWIEWGEFANARKNAKTSQDGTHQESESPDHKSVLGMRWVCKCQVECKNISRWNTSRKWISLGMRWVCKCQEEWYIWIHEAPGWSITDEAPKSHYLEEFFMVHDSSRYSFYIMTSHNSTRWAMHQKYTHLMGGRSRNLKHAKPFYSWLTTLQLSILQRLLLLRSFFASLLLQPWLEHHRRSTKISLWTPCLCVVNCPAVIELIHY